MLRVSEAQRGKERREEFRPSIRLGFGDVMGLPRPRPTVLWPMCALVADPLFPIINREPKCSHR